MDFVNKYLVLLKKIVRTVFCHSELTLNFRFDNTSKSWYLNVSTVGGNFHFYNLIKCNAILDCLFDKRDNFNFIRVKPRKKQENFDNYYECISIKYSITKGCVYKVCDIKGFTYNFWISPTILFILWRYPHFIYFRKINAMELILETKLLDLTIKFNKQLSNYFRTNRIYTIGDLTKYSYMEAMRFPGMDRRIITELDDMLESLNLTWANKQKI